MTITYIAPTARKPMTRAGRVRIFLSRNGQCWRCGVQIIAARDRWIVEHPDMLALGGSDNDDALWPAHERCGIEKTKEDAGKKASRDRAIDKGFAGKKAKGRPMDGSRNSPWRKPMNGKAVRRYDRAALSRALPQSEKQT